MRRAERTGSFVLSQGNQQARHFGRRFPKQRPIWAHAVALRCKLLSAMAAIRMKEEEDSVSLVERGNGVGGQPGLEYASLTLYTLSQELLFAYCRGVVEAKRRRRSPLSAARRRLSRLGAEAGTRNAETGQRV